MGALAPKVLQLTLLSCVSALIGCASQDERGIQSDETLSRVSEIVAITPTDLESLEPPPGTVPHRSLQSSESGGGKSWTPQDEPVVAYLRPVLKSSGKAARLSYAGSCRPNDHPFRVPPIGMQSPPSSEVGVAAVRAIFQDNDNVAVTEDPEGLIRIRIGDVRDEILQTKISRLVLRGRTQYDGTLSTVALDNAPEMRAARERLGMGHPLVHITSDIRGTIPADWTHLPSLISDLTADQILDEIARTFGGIVLYGVCDNPNDIRLVFVDAAL